MMNDAFSAIKTFNNRLEVDTDLPKSPYLRRTAWLMTIVPLYYCIFLCLINKPNSLNKVKLSQSAIILMHNSLLLRVKAVQLCNAALFVRRCRADFKYMRTSSIIWKTKDTYYFRKGIITCYILQIFYA